MSAKSIIMLVLALLLVQCSFSDNKIKSAVGKRSVNDYERLLCSSNSQSVELRKNFCKRLESLYAKLGSSLNINDFNGFLKGVEDELTASNSENPIVKDELKKLKALRNEAKTHAYNEAVPFLEKMELLNKVLYHPHGVLSNESSNSYTGILFAKYADIERLREMYEKVLVSLLNRYKKHFNNIEYNASDIISALENKGVRILNLSDRTYLLIGKTFFEILLENSMDEQASETENTDGDNVDGENVDGENVDGENADGENVEDDGQNTDGDNVDGENVDGENANGENVDGENANGENVDGEKDNVENVNSEIIDDENAGGENVDGENDDGLNTDGDNVGGENAN